MSFENSAGIGTRTNYGPRAVDEKFGAEVSYGNVREAEWVFSYDDLPTNSTGEMEVTIPANSVIKDARIQVLTAMAGTSGTLTVGLKEADGTVIDADGIDATVAQASLTAGTQMHQDA